MTMDMSLIAESGRQAYESANAWLAEEIIPDMTVPSLQLFWIVVVLPNLLAPILFTLVLYFRKGMRNLCCGSGRLTCWIFFLLQTVATLFRFGLAHAAMDCLAWGVWASPSSALDSLGLLLMGIGHILNLLVYYRLGITGVYYGNAFGVDIPWCHDFPFGGNYGIRHPQYTGVTLQVLGHALRTGTSAGMFFVVGNILSYLVIIPVEDYFFTLVGEEAAAKKKKGK